MKAKKQLPANDKDEEDFDLIRESVTRSRNGLTYDRSAFRAAVDRLGLRRFGKPNLDGLK